MTDEHALTSIDDDAGMTTSRRLAPAAVDGEAAAQLRKDFALIGRGEFGRLEDFAAWWTTVSGTKAHPNRIRLLVFTSNDQHRVPTINPPSSVSLRHIAIPEILSHAEQVARQAIDDEVDSGTDLLLIGHAGEDIRALTTALVVHAIGADLVDAMGTDLDDVTWMQVVERARESTRALRDSQVQELTQRLGSPDIAALASALTQAAIRGVPALIDGTVLAAAALIAQRLAPGSQSWWLASHRSRERAQVLALEELGMDYVLDLHLGVGDGGGALLALPVLLASIDLIPPTETR
jgi:NaMN:DMB phosphoribosyltransferase